MFLTTMKKAIITGRTGLEYIIQEDGKVYSTSYNYRGKELKQEIMKHGYLNCKAGYIHRLLAIAFIHNNDPINKTQVNHKDGNKLNNSLENLEWVTPSQNTKHAYDNGLVKNPTKGKSHGMYGKTYGKNPAAKPIIRLTLSGEVIDEFSCIKEASDKLKFPRKGIIYACKDNKQYRGFLWKYKNGGELK